jgi:hypothetical protein
VVQAAARAVRVARIDELVGGDRGTHPRAGLAAVVELDALVEAVAERLDAEPPVGADAGGEDVDVVQALDRTAAPGVAPGHVLERGAQVRRRFVARALVVELEAVAVGVAEAVGRAAGVIAVDPPLSQPGGLDRGDAALQALRARGAEAEDAHARGLGRRELQRPGLVVAPAAQVGRSARLVLDLHPDDVDEEAQARVFRRREQLDRAEVRDVVHPRSTSSRSPSSS